MSALIQGHIGGDDRPPPADEGAVAISLTETNAINGPTAQHNAAGDQSEITRLRAQQIEHLEIIEQLTRVIRELRRSMNPKSEVVPGEVVVRLLTLGSRSFDLSGIHERWVSEREFGWRNTSNTEEHTKHKSYSGGRSDDNNEKPFEFQCASATSVLLSTLLGPVSSNGILSISPGGRRHRNRLTFHYITPIYQIQVCIMQRSMRSRGMHARNTSNASPVLVFRIRLTRVGTQPEFRAGGGGQY